MYLEALSVCVSFHDVLAFTMLANKSHFDRMIVISDTADEQTKNLCSHHHVELIQTDQFYHSDQAFNKARGINVGLQRLSRKGWVLHMDADIVLPPRTRELLGNLPLDPKFIYGVDRMMCPDFAAWIRHMQNPVLQHTAETFVIPDAFPMGARVAPIQSGKLWMPIGFFQLWHPNGSGVHDYPMEHGTAGRTDMLHAMRWPRERRALIPELIAIHLEGPIPKGQKNWRGRRMGHFGPPQPEQPKPPPQPPTYCGE